MKKVLVISSSPRKGGNSDILADRFAEGAKAAGHDAEKVFLADKNINYCKACCACCASHKCVQNDDMAELLDKMAAADVVVLASPVYFYSMCAQMKTFIDRCFARYKELGGKDFYFIITAGNPDKSLMQNTIDRFRGYALKCLDNATEKKVIYGLGTMQKGDVKNLPAYDEAYQAGLEA